MDTPNRLFFAFLGAAAAFAGFVWIWNRWRSRGTSMLLDDAAYLRDVLRQVAAGLPGAIANDGLRFVHRGLHGRLDFIADQTEIQVRTGNLIGQVVEVVPVGFPMSLLGGGMRLRARGSKAEYDRIFREPADEQVLLELRVPYDLRMSPDGVILRVHALPESAATLSRWIACALRIVDLIP